MNVAIFGAGIGGLTVAHELSKLPGYKIKIYERHDAIGGVARTIRDEYGCSIEHSWRMYLWLYRNLRSILKEIPTDGKRNVNDNLITCNLKQTLWKKRDDGVTPSEYAGIAYTYIDYITSSDKRVRDRDAWKWSNVVQRSKPRELPWECIPQWLGMDRKNGSYQSVMRVGFDLSYVETGKKPGEENQIMNQPTSEGWFDYWQKHLESKGVEFYFNTTLESLSITSSKVQHAITTSDGNVQADYYVLGIPVESLVKVVNSSGSIAGLEKMGELADLSYAMMVCFSVNFDRPIYIDKKEDGYILEDSPWSLIIQTREVSWAKAGQPTISLCTSIPEVKGSWSILMSNSNTPGVLYGKAFKDCSEQECRDELWAQVMQNEQLRDGVRKSNGFDLDEKYVVRWSSSWPEYKWVGDKPSTQEPKFANNAGVLKLRPSSLLTSIPNLYISTAYTKEALDNYSMEGAATSGLTVAHSISGGKTRPPTYIDRSRTLLPLQKVDEYFYSIGWPNLGPPLLVLLVFLVVFLFVIVVKRMLSRRER